LAVLLSTVPKYVPDTDIVAFDGAGSSETTVRPALAREAALLVAED
jgi:hypothetical protein